jgi:hypothetical protein
VTFAPLLPGYYLIWFGNDGGSFILHRSRRPNRMAAIMSLIQYAKLNGHDPYLYLKDVMERRPTQSASRLEELMPHHWLSQGSAQV